MSSVLSSDQVPLIPRSNSDPELYNSCIVHEGVENAPLESGGGKPVTEEVIVRLKRRKPHERIHSAFIKDKIVYANPPSPLKFTNSGKRIEYSVGLMPGPRGMMVGIRLKDEEQLASVAGPTIKETGTGNRKSVRFEKSPSFDDLQSLLGSGSAIARGLDALDPNKAEDELATPKGTKPLEPQVETPTGKVEDSRLKKLIWAILSAIYNLAMAIFDAMKRVACCWTPTVNAIKA